MSRPCDFFTSGNCYYGSSCAYSHDIPPCRFIIPEVEREEITYEKEKIIRQYKNERSLIPCKHFNGQLGSCPFGRDCFYLHLNYDGEDVEKSNDKFERLMMMMELEI